MSQMTVRRVMFAIIIALASAALCRAEDSSSDEGVRDIFAAVFEREMLKMGYDIRASAQDGRNERLLILGSPVTRVEVFWLITDVRLLASAHKAGFRKIEILNLSGSGKWIFDLSNGLPKCDTHASVCRE